MVTPNVGVPAPDLPQITLPSITPAMPSVSDGSPQFNAARRAWELKVADHQRNRETRTSHTDRVDYAEALIHLERYEEAIDELESLEEKYPDAYANAYLLGIACERSGNLPAAQRWFAAAVERDPEAQEGTGWLRVAMIEAHLQLKTDPTWLDTHSVLDGCAGRSEADLVRAMEIQVEARRDFFAPNDPVIADLYFQIGARMTSPEARNRYFAQSLEIDPLRQNDIEEQQVVRAKGPAASEAH